MTVPFATRGDWINEARFNPLPPGGPHWKLALLALVVLGVCTAHGCAVLAGGAAGAATGYVAGHEAAK